MRNLLLKFQCAEYGRNVELWLRSVCSLPGEICTVRIFPLRTKEIRAPRFRRIEIRRERTHGDGKLRTPQSGTFINAGNAPHLAIEITARLFRYLQVNP